MTHFSMCSAPFNRAAAVVDDLIRDAIGDPTTATRGELVWNVTTQPSGADVFSAGQDVAHATAIALPLAVAGYYLFALTDNNGTTPLEIVAWPAGALTVPRLQYTSPTSVGSTIRSPESRSRQDIVTILRSLTAHSSAAGIQASIESGAGVAPYYGVRPTTLGAAHSDNLIPFGGSW
jgi:hypothetical protein